jgi:hypothetical protein
MNDIANDLSKLVEQLRTEIGRRDILIEGQDKQIVKLKKAIRRKK